MAVVGLGQLSRQHHCSFLNLIKCFIVLAVIATGSVLMLYNVSRYRPSSWMYRSDKPNNSYVMTNISEARIQSRVNHASQRRVTIDRRHHEPSPLASMLPEELEDWLTVDSYKELSKMVTPGFETKSSSGLEALEAKIKWSVATNSKPSWPTRPPLTTVGLPQKLQTSSPLLHVNLSHSVSGDSSCNQSCRWWREQDIRQRRVQETCSDIKNTRTSPAISFNLVPGSLRSLSHLLVLDSHKLIYCYVPKVGCTNWKRIFLVAKGIFPLAQEIEQRTTHVQTDKHMRLLSSYPLREAKRMLNEYRKFMFVRHPFERIVSAFIDKFEMDYPSSTTFRRDFGPSVARYGDRSKAQTRRKDGTLNVTFRQFVLFVSDPKNRILEPHWSEMYSQCQPCMIHYDILGNYSSLVEDAKVVIESAGLNQEFPASTNPTGSSERIRQYFSQLSPADIKALYNRYSIDFRLFGYSMPDGLI